MAKRPLPRKTAPEKITDIRPWGGYHRLAHNEHCTIKVLWVDPGHTLSLQTHKYRSEYWYVLENEMEVEIDGVRTVVGRDEHIFVPQGVKHRVRGLEKACRWLEIAFGHFDEDDIERYEDQYGRV